MTLIMNAALTSQGLDEIDETQYLPEHRVLMRNWPLIVEAEQEHGALIFNDRQKDMSSRIPGLYGFTDGYAIPGDVLFIREVWTTINGKRNRDITWVQDDLHIYLNAKDGCTIKYAQATDATHWSANFSRGIQMKLEAVLLRAIKEETSEAAAMEQMAEMQLQQARTLSSKSRSASEPFKQPGRLALARFGHRRG